MFWSVPKKRTEIFCAEAANRKLPRHHVGGLPAAKIEFSQRAAMLEANSPIAREAHLVRPHLFR